MRATYQSISKAESAIFMLIREARTGAADAGSCTDSQRASKKRGGKKRGSQKALGWAKPLAGPLATGGLGACSRGRAMRRRAEDARTCRPAKGGGAAFVPVVA